MTLNQMEIDELYVLDYIYGPSANPYVLMKKPASAKHFTFVAAGRSVLNLSQLRIDVNPPAEHPDRTACIGSS